MENYLLSNPSEPMIFSPGQSVVAFLGLKRKHWPMKDQFETIAREWLGNMGITVKEVKCYKKIGQNMPYIDSSEVNVFLRIEGLNSVTFY
ncbi:MAG: hypothetical protein HYV53_02800 [Parcubacteria group bacterium]|nr:hypothetical protein [Parcubacteria group bacterium]